MPANTPAAQIATVIARATMVAFAAHSRDRDARVRVDDQTVQIVREEARTAVDEILGMGEGLARLGEGWIRKAINLEANRAGARALDRVLEAA